MKLNYITVLSNWLIGYEKYSKTYSKRNLTRSTYKNEFYLLKEDELDIGLRKASNLIAKISLENNLITDNNKIIRIETDLDDSMVKKNERNGLGWVIDQNWIPVSRVYAYHNEQWLEFTPEDITALSYKLNSKDLKAYADLVPRSISLLPVAQACQADCKFCFSESSISFDQKRSLVDLENLNKLCKAAKENGAERFVITGGGEPTLIKFDTLLDIIKLAKQYFNKVVLISNGMFLSEENEEIILNKINKMIDAGLTVLSLSYHHYTFEQNAYIMNKEIKTDYLLSLIKNHKLNERLTTRLICVLQKEGVNNAEEIENYINYAILQKVAQVCFKELYISSTEESMYAGKAQNIYSEKNQISLSVLTHYLNENSVKIAELPWGSPVYRYKDVIDIAAYTEPSVGWERLNGIARSWNVMADGKCYVSLEDKDSLLELK